MGTEKISKINFNSGSCTFTEKKPLVSSFKKVRYKGRNIIYFNILNGLL